MFVARQFNYPFTIIPNQLITDQKLTPYERLVMIYLLYRSFAKNGVQVSLTTISQELGISRREAIECLKGLVQKGYISKHTITGGANVYYINDVYGLGVDVRGDDKEMNSNGKSEVQKVEVDNLEIRKKALELCKRWKENVWGAMEIDIVARFIREYGYEAVERAMEESARQGIYKLSYVQAILNNQPTERGYTYEEIVKLLKEKKITYDDVEERNGLYYIKQTKTKMGV
jgi:DNA-binding Lrp family transcriptional regulator